MTVSSLTQGNPCESAKPLSFMMPSSQSTIAQLILRQQHRHQCWPRRQRFASPAVSFRSVICSHMHSLLVCMCVCVCVCVSQQVPGGRVWERCGHHRAYQQQYFGSARTQGQSVAWHVIGTTASCRFPQAAAVLGRFLDDEVLPAHHCQTRTLNAHHMHIYPLV